MNPHRMEIAPIDTAGEPAEGMWEELGTYPDRAKAEIMLRAYVRAMRGTYHGTSTEIIRIVRVNDDGTLTRVGGYGWV